MLIDTLIVLWYPWVKSCVDLGLELPTALFENAKIYCSAFRKLCGKVGFSTKYARVDLTYVPVWEGV